MKILITGATGNVGKKVLELLSKHDELELYAGVRDTQKAKQRLGAHYRYKRIDFEQSMFEYEAYDVVFLMRPPQVSNAKLFKVFLDKLPKNTKIVFLSVQGADKKSYLPHAKIEKIIQAMQFEYVFLRPSYFMENLLTTLLEELKVHKRIYLPSGDMKLNWISIDDIAQAAVKAIQNSAFQKQIDLCNTTLHGFEDVVSMINSRCDTGYTYDSVSVLKYVYRHIKNKTPIMYIFVQLLLHYFPKFSQDPKVCDIKKVLGREPISLEEFIDKNCDTFKTAYTYKKYRYQVEKMNRICLLMIAVPIL